MLSWFIFRWSLSTSASWVAAIGAALGGAAALVLPPDLLSGSGCGGGAAAPDWRALRLGAGERLCLGIVSSFASEKNASQFIYAISVARTFLRRRQE